ncbi:MAG: RNA polymerase subunit sigma-70 [Zetaproteobacteria bacterium CG_4_9_14_3_um_filter_53_7]|nr:MAG: RNA polymerase subunit sigma-70 [Zetaproteobacteria bacterium CG_4_9_14_3_um_filter_53_7]
MSENNDPHLWLNDHGDYLYRYAFSRLHNEDLAADMLQETLLAGWKGFNNFAGQSSIRTWLTGILQHKIIDHIRREIRNRKLTESVENDPTSAYFNENGSWREVPSAWKDNPEALCQSEQFHAVLESCISKLPEKQQIIFRMRDITGEDSDTICKSCDMTSTHLHVLLHRARLALRKCLEWNWFGQGSRP